MKALIRIFLLLLLLCSACSGFELEEATSKTDGKENTDKGDADDEPTDSMVYTVRTLSSVPDTTDVTLRAYIVGYMPGSSVRGTIFSADGAVQTNIVLADSPDEQDVENCATAQLLKDTDVREALNLQDNPDLLHARVKLTGLKMKYCYAAGLKPVYDYEILTGDDSDDDNSDDDSSDEDADADKAHRDFPTWSEESAEVFEGC